MNALALLDDLTFYNYATNRDEAPAITPESWKKVYGPSVDEMEARYQAERAKPKQSVPPLKTCGSCGSMYCGPLRCRFEDTEAISRGVSA